MAPSRPSPSVEPPLVAPTRRPHLSSIRLAAMLFVVLLGVFALAAVQVLAYQGAVSRDDFTIAGRYPVPVSRFAPTGARVPVVAVVAHGFGGSKSVMSALGVELARAGITAYTFDAPGHGASQVPFAAGGRTDYDGSVAAASTQFDATVDEVAQYALRHSASPDTQVVLIGHSMGTEVVSSYAMRRPGSVPLAGVVLISPVVPAISDPAAFPRLLAIAGSNDLPKALDSEGQLTQALCGQPLPPAGVVETCSSTKGAAREFRILPTLNHISIVTAPQTIAVVLDFLRREVAPAMPNTTVQADTQTHWLIVGVLAAALASAPLLVILTALLRAPTASAHGALGHPSITIRRALAGEGLLIGAAGVGMQVQRFVTPSPLTFLRALTAPDIVTVMAVTGLVWLALLLLLLPSARQTAHAAGRTWWRQLLVALLLVGFLYVTLGWLATYAYTDVALTPAKLWRFAVIAVLLLAFFGASEWLHGVTATSAPRMAIVLSALAKVIVLIALASLLQALLSFVVAIFLYFVGMEALARRGIREPVALVPVTEALVLAWAIAAVYPFVT